MQEPFLARQRCGKNSGDFCTTEFPHPVEITLRHVAESRNRSIKTNNQQQRHEPPKVYFLTNYKASYI